MNAINRIGRLLAVIAGVVTLTLISEGTDAKERKGARSEVVKVVGMLTVTLDAKQNVKAIDIRDDAGEVYHIVADGKSVKMAKKHDGKTMKVTGTVNRKLTDKGNGVWLNVRKFKVVPHAEEENIE